MQHPAVGYHFGNKVIKSSNPITVACQDVEGKQREERRVPKAQREGVTRTAGRCSLRKTQEGTSWKGRNGLLPSLQWYGKEC